MEDWKKILNFKLDQSIILYSVRFGRVYGGSDPKRKLKEKISHSGGDFKFELDLSNRSLVMEIDHERIILDANLGDFQYSPFIRLWGDRDEPPVEVTIL